MKKKEGGVEGGGAKPFFIAPRISHRGSKHAPHASTQQDSTPPRAASSLRYHRGFGAVGGGCWVWKRVAGTGWGTCSGIFPPAPLPHLFIYLHPGILPNPSHFPWLSHPHFHSQDTLENMFDFFFFFLAGTRFLVGFFFFKKKLPSLPPRNAAAVPVLPMFILGCLPAPVALMLAPHSSEEEPKAG